MDRVKKWATVPPMGWNSYDYYNTMVNEDQVKANALVMSKELKEFGYNYIVVDIQWSDPRAGETIPRDQYVPFTTLCVDEYSRQIPDPVRFPSSANGKGFKPLADYIHSLGLKFGIHIMRGIPRQCCHNHSKTITPGITADMIANPFSVSKWNGDMYGVDYTRKGAREYYESIVNLYAEWGVDFIKCDDICNTNMYPDNPYSAKKEIEMLSNAISQCGRDMVLSLSPGPALIEKAWHLKKYASMWRITDDFWDNWPLLKNMFTRCELWQDHVGEGSWPDCDMIPVGKVGAGFGQERDSLLTEDEQKTLMTLWCIFRSPLILGCELTKLDEKTKSIICNKDLLDLQQQNYKPKLLESEEDWCIWSSTSEDKTKTALAFFNTGEEERTVSINLDKKYHGKNLWTKEEITAEKEFSVKLMPHCCAAFLLEEN